MERTHAVFCDLHHHSECCSLIKIGKDKQHVAMEFGKGLNQAHGHTVKASPSRIKEGNYSHRVCPCCGHQMMLCQNQGVELDVCPNCSAHWFDPGELKQITGLLEDLPGLKYKSRKSRFICPNCDIPMREYVFVNPRTSWLINAANVTVYYSKPESSTARWP